MLDIDFVRSQFPAFQSEALAGQAFFDSAGGSYPCQQVIDRLMRFYHDRKVQPYGAFEASELGGQEMDEARVRLAALMGVEVDELSFGPSTTQNTYVLSQAFREWLKPGDAIIVTNQDHEANTGSWRRLAAYGIDVRKWAVHPDTGSLALSDLEELLDGKVKLVCFPHCSNIVAEVNPVAEIVSLAHAVGAYVCVDGVSYAPHGLPDVSSLGADIYLFSTYKTYGPHQGIMVIRRDLGMKLPIQGFHYYADVLKKRFTPAGPDHAQIAACAGIADYFDALYAHHFSKNVSACERGSAVHNLMRNHEIKLLQPLLDAVSKRNDVRLIGPTNAAQRAPTVAIGCHQPGHEVAKKLAKHGVNAGGGNFDGVRVLKAMGIDPEHGVLRLSFVHYTSENEVARAIEALEAIL